MQNEALELSLSQLSNAIRRRRISSREATTACLEAIDQFQPTINCFIHVEPERALAMAERADHDIAAGRRLGPLHGVPLAHKDIFYRAGCVSTCGSRIRKNWRPDISATVLQRLDSAGAVDLGGLNLAEFCVGPTGHNDYFGHCRNPWNPERISGGSSSGSGASVAARLVYGSVGSDTGGSIRLPAGMCGVVGMKPTHGRVSLFGAMPRCWSLDVFGPLTRTVRDSAIILQAIAGYDPKDECSRPVPVPSYTGALRQSAQGLRIGVPVNHLMPALHDSIRKIHEESLEALQAVGCEIVHLSMPDPEALYELTTIINKVEATAIHAEWVRTRPDDYNLSTITRVADGFEIPALRYIEVLNRRKESLADFKDAVFSKADVLYAPLLPIEIPTIAETAITSHNDAPVIVHEVTRCTRWVSYLGLPVLTVPCGFSSGDLPVAFQLVGRPFDEATLLRIGNAFQKETAWHKRRPPMLDS